MLMNDMIRNKAKLNQLNYFLMAMKDPIDMLENIRHLGSSQTAIDNYKKEVFEEFTKNVTHPICRTIEEDLRKQIHQIIIPQLKQTNPIENRPSDTGAYARMNELFLFEKQINMKEEIGTYLSHIFYEMSALSPHDFRTYEHMRVIAAEKLGVYVQPSHLPSQQLE